MVLIQIFLYLKSESYTTRHYRISSRGLIQQSLNRLLIFEKDRGGDRAHAGRSGISVVTGKKEKTETALMMLMALGKETRFNL